MAIDLHRRPHGAHDTTGIDEVGDAVRRLAMVFERPVLGRDLLVGIRQKREPKIVLVTELGQRAGSVGTDTHDRGTQRLKVGQQCVERLSFARTARGVRLGIEVEYKPSTLKVFQRQQ